MHSAISLVPASLNSFRTEEEESGRRLPIGFHCMLGCTLLLSACGSGSSSGGVEPFTGFGSIDLNGTTKIEGKAQTAAITFHPETGGIADLFAGDTTTDAAVLFSVDDAYLVSVTLDQSGNKLVFGEASEGDIWDAGLYLYAFTDDGDKVIFLADDIELGLLYNTFGTWFAGLNGARGDFGAFSVGLPTGDIPEPFETYQYSGDSMGMIRFSDGSFDLTRSDLTIVGYFATNTVEMNVTGTRTMGNFANVLPEYPEYDFSGVGSVVSGEFEVDVTGELVAGTATGTFFGPDFEGVGGTFLTTAPDDETYIGAFGAIRD